jgi:hypothetical protein
VCVYAVLVCVLAGAPTAPAASSTPLAKTRVSTRRHKIAGPKQMMETTPPDSSPEKTNAALGRIEMPPDAVERIAKLPTPGSSLVVSDYGISKETGPDTDFIVETQ